MAVRPRETVRFSNTSATSTKSVMTRAVKNWPMAAAATMAMTIESSMVIRRARIFSSASAKIGQPPITMPTSPMRLKAENGSQRRSPTATAARATKTMRTASDQVSA